jgi:hypothetical protein
MALLACSCGCLFAVGLPRCPQCQSADFTEDGALVPAQKPAVADFQTPAPAPAAPAGTIGGAPEADTGADPDQAVAPVVTQVSPGHGPPAEPVSAPEVAPVAPASLT